MEDKKMDIAKDVEDSPKIEETSDEVTAMLKKLKRRRIARNCFEILEIVGLELVGLSAFYLLGNLVGYNKGFANGYSSGKISGEHSMLSEYVKNRVWRAS